MPFVQSVSSSLLESIRNIIRRMSQRPRFGQRGDVSLAYLLLSRSTAKSWSSSSQEQEPKAQHDYSVELRSVAYKPWVIGGTPRNLSLMIVGATKDCREV